MTLFYFSYLDANCSPSLPLSQHHLLAQRLRLCLGCGFGGGRRNKALRKLQLMPRFPLGRSLGGEKKITLQYYWITKGFFSHSSTALWLLSPWVSFPGKHFLPRFWPTTNFIQWHRVGCKVSTGSKLLFEQVSELQGIKMPNNNRQRWWRDWSIFHVRGSWESWGCSARRRQGSGSYHYE